MNLQDFTPYFVPLGLFLVVLLFFCLLYAIRVSLKYTKVSIAYREMSEEWNQNKINTAVLTDRFAEITARLEKTMAENEALKEALAIAQRETATVKTAAAAREEGLNEKIAFLEKIKEDLSLKFKDISSEIIKAQHESFSAEQKSTLSVILNPFTEQLKAFRTEVTAAKEENIKSKSTLDAELKNLRHLNETLSADAQNLTEALKGGKKTQGNWGEYQLHRLLEISGLRKGVDYETEVSMKNEEDKRYRPDVIIHLPENRDIVIDSKVSMVNYLDSMTAASEDERKAELQKNLACIKKHIEELSKKDYQKLIKCGSLNYVIMFIPVESAYIAALECDTTLFDYAYARNIIISTPLSLLPTLRTVANLWQMDSQNKNAEEIARRAGQIYDQLSAFMKEMEKIDNALNSAHKAYNNARVKIIGQKGALMNAQKIRALGAKTSKDINLLLSDEALLLEYDEETAETKEEENA